MRPCQTRFSAGRKKNVRYKKPFSAALGFDLPCANDLARDLDGIFAISTDFIRTTVILVIKHYK